MYTVMDYLSAAYFKCLQVYLLLYCRELKSAAASYRANHSKDARLTLEIVPKGILNVNYAHELIWTDSYY